MYFVLRKTILHDTWMYIKRFKSILCLGNKNNNNIYDIKKPLSMTYKFKSIPLFALRTLSSIDIEICRHVGINIPLLIIIFVMSNIALKHS